MERATWEGRVHDADAEDCRAWIALLRQTWRPMSLLTRAGRAYWIGKFRRRLRQRAADAAARAGLAKELV